MKNTTIPLTEIREHRLGLRIAARLSAGAADLPHDVQEQLRAARERAVTNRKCPVTVAVPQSAGHAAVLGHAGGAVALGGLGGFNGLGRFGEGWWSHALSIGVALALAAGLVVIDVVQSDENASEVASVDTALLTDDLPPQAYADPGFAQFLKTGETPAAAAPEPN